MTKQKEAVQPLLVEEDKGMNTKTYEHPAWGMIQVGRVSGLVDLFGSALQHQHFIRLSIGVAKKIVDDSGEERHSGSLRGEIAEVFLSEGQWAQLLSSMNMGAGVPCTLAYIQGKPVPKAPQSKMLEQFHDAAKEKVLQVGQELLDLKKAVAQRFEDKKPLSVKEKADMLGWIDSAVRSLTDQLPFIQSMMQEKLEEQVGRAKIEIDSFLQFKAQLLGFNQITEKIAALPDGSSSLVIEDVDGSDSRNP